MKHIIKSLALVGVFGLLLAACEQPTYLVPDKNLIPKAADIQVTVNVSYDENFLSTVQFDYTAPASTVPAFIFGSTDVVTKSSFSRTYKKAGTYSVEVKAYNQHGISDGSKIIDFTIDYDYIAPYDPTDDIKRLSDGTSKTWVMDAATAGHLGCGPSGGNGLDWWSAGPNEKAGWSMYDDQLIFNADGTYTFDPVDGYIYVNTGSGFEPTYNLNDGNDYIAPAQVMNSTWSLEFDTDLFLNFPANTLIGYVPNAEALSNPHFKILTLTASVLEFVADNGNIAWHYRFIPLDPNAGQSDEDKLTGGSTKSWKWAFMESGHLACGSEGSTGMDWWSAGPLEKTGFGVYDDVLTFGMDGSFTMDPGKGGTIYVNKDSGYGTEYNPNDGNDYQVPFTTQTSSWSLYTEGGVQYLEFPAQTVVGYVPNAQALTSPKFRVLSISADKLELAIDGPGIVWHFLFVPASFEGEEMSASNFAAGLVGSWTWEPSVGGHFGCGASGGSGLDWWSAGPNEKAGTGLYDDVLSFGGDGVYVYNPGPDGMLYCNWECGFHSELWSGTANEDYNVPVEEQTATYTLDERTITFPANTFVSYIPNAGTLANPVYQIVKMTPYVMELVTDNGAIAWRYRFTRAGQ